MNGRFANIPTMRFHLVVDTQTWDFNILRHGGSNQQYNVNTEAHGMGAYFFCSTCGRMHDLNTTQGRVKVATAFDNYKQVSCSEACRSQHKPFKASEGFCCHLQGPVNRFTDQTAWCPIHG